jgi:cholesterol transport system auxiliary component
MKRRVMLLGAASLAGCSVLPSQPYLQKRDWPLVLRRPTARPPRQGGAVLLVRTMAAGPGVEARGLQWLLPDGSVHIGFYEEWAVPPALAVDDALRQWLADSGMFSAVVGPGSRINADLVLETELTTLIADPAASVARAGVALVLLDQRRQPARVLLQKTETATAPLAAAAPPAMVRAMRAALGSVLQQTERDIGVAAA